MRTAEIYVDGVCFFNGTKYARAGIGVWWGNDHPNNISEPLKGYPTNIRADLYSVVRGINQAAELNYECVNVLTKSDFVINCINSWINKWVNNGWINSKGRPVKNKDEIIKLLQAMSKIKVHYFKLKSESKIYGNDQANRLAREGMERYDSDSDC